MNKINNENIYIEVAEMIRIANQAAKKENIRFGIPETFFRNGKLYYVLSNGEITDLRPEILK